MEEWKKYGCRSEIEFVEVMSEINHDNEKLLEKEIEKILINNNKK